MQLLIELYLAFVRIGFGSFGGLSSVALILDEMTSHGWMTASDLSNLVGIAEMTPGPLGMNCATFCGLQTAGIPGSIAAVLGVLTPCMTLAMAVAVFYQKFKEAKAMQWALKVIKPVSIAMIADAFVSLVQSNYVTEDSRPLYVGILIGLVCFYLLYKKRWSVPRLVILSGCAGALLFGVGGMLL